MIIGNISWNQHKFSNILQKYWQIIPSHTVTLYISEIEISLLTKIFLNLSTISKMNVIRYLTLIDYKGRRGEFLFFDNWAESECWACFVEISYLEADNGDLVLMVTDIMTKMKTVAKLVSAIFLWPDWSLTINHVHVRTSCFKSVFRWAPQEWRWLVLQS